MKSLALLVLVAGVSLVLAVPAPRNTLLGIAQGIREQVGDRQRQKPQKSVEDLENEEDFKNLVDDVFKKFEDGELSDEFVAENSKVILGALNKKKEQKRKEGKTPSGGDRTGDREEKTKVDEILNNIGLDRIQATADILSQALAKGCETAKEAGARKCEKGETPEAHICLPPRCALDKGDFTKCSAVAQDKETVFGEAIMSILSIGKERVNNADAKELGGELGIDVSIVEAVLGGGAKPTETEQKEFLDAIYDLVEEECEDNVPEEGDACSVKETAILERVRNKHKIVAKLCKENSSPCDSSRSDEVKKQLDEVKQLLEEGELSREEIKGKMPTCCPDKLKSGEEDLSTDKEERKIPCCRPDVCGMGKEDLGRLIKAKITKARKVMEAKEDGDEGAGRFGVQERPITASVEKLGSRKEASTRDREAELKRVGQQAGLSKDDTTTLVGELRDDQELKQDVSKTGQVFRKFKRECEEEAPSADAAENNECNTGDLEAQDIVNKAKEYFGGACPSASEAEKTDPKLPQGVSVCSRDNRVALEGVVGDIGSILAGVKKTDVIDTTRIFNNAKCFDKLTCEKAQEVLTNKEAKFCYPTKCDIGFDQFAQTLKEALSGKKAETAGKIPLKVAAFIESRCFDEEVEDADKEEEINSIKAQLKLTTAESNDLKDICEKANLDKELTDVQKETLMKVAKLGIKDDCDEIDSTLDECDPVAIKTIALDAKVMDKFCKNEKLDPCTDPEVISKFEKAIGKFKVAKENEIAGIQLGAPDRESGSSRTQSGSGDDGKKLPQITCIPEKICDTWKTKHDRKTKLNGDTACLPKICKFGERVDKFADKAKAKLKEMKMNGGNSGKKTSNRQCTIQNIRSGVQKLEEQKEQEKKERKQRRGAYRFTVLKSGNCPSNPDSRDIMVSEKKRNDLCKAEGKGPDAYINVCEYALDSDDNGVWIKKEFQCKLVMRPA